MEREYRHYGSTISGRPPHGHAVAIRGHSSTITEHGRIAYTRNNGRPPPSTGASASLPPFVSSPPPVGFSSYGWKGGYERAGLSFFFALLRAHSCLPRLTVPVSAAALGLYYMWNRPASLPSFPSSPCSPATGLRLLLRSCSPLSFAYIRFYSMHLARKASLLPCIYRCSQHVTWGVEI